MEREEEMVIVGDIGRDSNCHNRGYWLASSRSDIEWESIFLSYVTVVTSRHPLNGRNFWLSFFLFALFFFLNFDF